MSGICERHVLKRMRLPIINILSNNCFGVTFLLCIPATTLLWEVRLLAETTLTCDYSLPVLMFINYLLGFTDLYSCWDRSAPVGNTRHLLIGPTVFCFFNSQCTNSKHPSKNKLHLHTASVSRFRRKFAASRGLLFGRGWQWHGAAKQYGRTSTALSGQADPHNSDPCRHQDHGLYGQVTKLYINNFEL